MNTARPGPGLRFAMPLPRLLQHSQDDVGPAVDAAGYALGQGPARLLGIQDRAAFACVPAVPGVDADRQLAGADAALDQPRRRVGPRAPLRGETTCVPKLISNTAATTARDPFNGGRTTAAAHPPLDRPSASSGTAVTTYGTAHFPRRAGGVQAHSTPSSASAVRCTARAR